MTQAGFKFQYTQVYLIVDAPLCSPPSELSSFRDVSLYAKIYNYEDVLLVAEKGTRSYYWEWMSKNGIRDYISDIITPRETLDMKYIRIKENQKLPWEKLVFYSNGFSIKALHQSTFPIILEYLKLVAD